MKEKKLTRGKRIGLVAILAISVSVLHARQDPDADNFWTDPDRAQPAAAAQMVLSGHPHAILAMRQKALDQLVFKSDLQLTSDLAPPLNPAWFKSIKDNQPFPNYQGRKVEELTQAEKDEYYLYCRALIQSYHAEVEAFEKSGLKNVSLKISDLGSKPAQHRGKVISLGGRLLQLSKYPAPAAAELGGVAFHYEALIQLPDPNSDPVKVLFTQDRGFPRSKNQPIRFHGYFIKNIPYQEGKKISNIPLLIGPTLVAQAPPRAKLDTKKFPQEDDRFLEEGMFWSIRSLGQPAAAAQLALTRQPWTLLALAMAGKEFRVWDEPTSEAGAPPLSPTWLQSMTDNGPLPDFRGKIPRETPKADRDEYSLYCQALVLSHLTPREAFKKSSQENAHLKFGHLYEDPVKYRGLVIPIRGILKRLRKMDAPLYAQQQGVRFVYEGWVFGDTKNAHPFCVIFTQEATGIPLSENLNEEVSFYGYFFKKYRYKGGGKERVTPLLIGPSLVLHGSQSETPVSLYLLWGIVGFFAVVGVLMVFVHLWFRRDDQQVRVRLAQLQAERTLVNLEDESSGDKLGPPPTPGPASNPDLPEQK